MRLPMGNEPLPVTGVRIVRVSALAADVESEQIALLSEKKCMIELAVMETMTATLAGVRPGLNVPVVHELGIRNPCGCIIPIPLLTANVKSKGVAA